MDVKQVIEAMDQSFRSFDIAGAKERAMEAARDCNHWLARLEPWKMKEDKALSRVPIIMLTAKGTPRDVINGINAGARHYITKPFKQAELLEKVSRALGRR